MPSMVAAVEGYLDHLVVERGLSAHTIGAYRRDLSRYADYLGEQGVTEPTAVTATMINEYAMRLREGVPGAEGEGWAERPLGPASVARPWWPYAACTGSCSPKGSPPMTPLRPCNRRSRPAGCPRR